MSTNWLESAGIVRLRSHEAPPRDGHADMRIGLPTFREPRSQTRPALLLQPSPDEPRAPSTDLRSHA